MTTRRDVFNENLAYDVKNEKFLYSVAVKR
jgi:hypothetical protein